MSHWLDLIANPRVPRRCAGVPVTIPAVGDIVQVRQGENLGQQYTVLAVIGNAYAVDQKVFVNHPSDVLTWYYPWNLEVQR